ncbi:MAG: hypothetical protein B7X84_01330 [Alphaproteobacteria bacterium 17-39-52]|nr:MAG: hypothetical protein B7X84_01330 [Alphaproteobacteria bacterium 17-39-52]
MQKEKEVFSLRSLRLRGCTVQIRGLKLRERIHRLTERLINNVETRYPQVCSVSFEKEQEKRVS